MKEKMGWYSFRPSGVFTTYSIIKSHIREILVSNPLTIKNCPSINP